MAAPYLDLMSKVEAAGKAVVDALILTGSPLSFTGLDDDSKTLPLTLVSAEQTGQEVPLRSGNHVVTLRIAHKTQANDESLVTHRSRVATIFDAFRDDTIGTTLSGHVTDFYVFDVWDVRFGRGGYSRPDETAVMEDWIELDIVCCAADIS